MPARTHIRSLALAGMSAAALALWPMSLGAGTARAAQPVHQTVEDHLVVADVGEQCGFAVEWEISLTGHITLFLEDGVPVRIQGHFQEHNLLTNLETGKTVEDNPTFNQRVFFEDGVLKTVETDGLFVNARGDGGESVMDVGRVVLDVIDSMTRELAFEGGQHPFRELTLTDLEPGLAAFCDVLA